ncbi:MAG: hypothetical protein V1721_04365 [Pseudomonadota bacterium]
MPDPIDADKSKEGNSIRLLAVLVSVMTFLIVLALGFVVYGFVKAWPA